MLKIIIYSRHVLMKLKIWITRSLSNRHCLSLQRWRDFSKMYLHVLKLVSLYYGFYFDVSILWLYTYLRIFRTANYCCGKLIFQMIFVRVSLWYIFTFTLQSFSHHFCFVNDVYIRIYDSLMQYYKYDLISYDTICCLHKETRLQDFLCVICGVICISCINICL